MDGKFTVTLSFLGNDLSTQPTKLKAGTEREAGDTESTDPLRAVVEGMPDLRCVPGSHRWMEASGRAPRIKGDTEKTENQRGMTFLLIRIKEN